MAGLRLSMAGLHTWAGLLAGWLLYAIFITGGVSYFREELTQWLRPEIPVRPAVLDQTAVAQRALATLEQQAGTADSWQIMLPGPRSNAVEIAWELSDDQQRAWLEPATGALLQPRATQAGEFFYYFHFSLHYLPATLGRWIVGLCAMMSLVTLLSGVIVHRRIFSDFFTFRPGKGQRSWLDAHNVGSVLGLPFYLMIVYTGLVTLMFTYMPWGAQAVLGQQARPALAQVMQPRFETPPRSGIAAPLPQLTPLMAQAAARWGDGNIGRVLVTEPGDAAARIAIVHGDHDRLSVRPSYLLFDASGALLAKHDGASPAVSTWGAAYALHLGRYADPVLRWLYFLSSMLGAAMVATGLVLWSVKRQQKPDVGLRLVQTGNVACIAGLPIAVAAFLLANRLLPDYLPDRAAWEVHCFFLCWALAALWAIRRPAWRELWLAAGLLWTLLPLTDAWTVGTRFVIFDIVFLLVAILCFYVRIIVTRYLKRKP
nr:PepSY-associated TM helix domain-containing protein [uncultured Duganella sp.]